MGDRDIQLKDKGDRPLPPKFMAQNQRAHNRQDGWENRRSEANPDGQDQWIQKTRIGQNIGVSLKAKIILANDWHVIQALSQAKQQATHKKQKNNRQRRGQQ